MKLTPTVVVQIGAFVSISGTLLMTLHERSPHELVFFRAFAAITLGLFFIQIGYAQSLSEKAADDQKKDRALSDSEE